VGVRAWGGPDGDRHPSPIATHPLHAFVTEPLKPFLDKVIVSANLHVYVSQTDRGECVIGSEIDPYASYSYRSTLPFLENTAHHTLELFPYLTHVRVLRQ
jgi:sarcosine oxidase subunit beta